MTDEESKKLGQRIKSKRRKKVLSQELLAEMVEYKVSTISKYEQGYRIPTIGMLRKLAEVLECEVSDLTETSEKVIKKTIRFEDAVKSYIDWLRGVHIIVSTTVGYEVLKTVKL